MKKDKRTNNDLQNEILLTMPSSTAKAERSFSVLKRVKTPLRGTMGQERLSVLVLLHIHSDNQLQL
jgi:hypothetical protein